MKDDKDKKKKAIPSWLGRFTGKILKALNLSNDAMGVFESITDFFVW